MITAFEMLLKYQDNLKQLKQDDKLYQSSINNH